MTGHIIEVVRYAGREKTQKDVNVVKRFIIVLGYVKNLTEKNIKKNV
jgi:hypothetical protein